MKRLIGLNIAVALAAAFAVLGAAEKTEERTRLSGAGASFPSKIYT
jgi:predicted outer membrane lipoprotein|tara:strand:+ start:1231 stop:1368 length:138 start_codon:yes stop_codon:yes gene_type:complete